MSETCAWRWPARNSKLDAPKVSRSAKLRSTPDSRISVSSRKSIKRAMERLLLPLSEGVEVAMWACSGSRAVIGLRARCRQPQSFVEGCIYFESCRFDDPQPITRGPAFLLE